jgi:hypothetical protein
MNALGTFPSKPNTVKKRVRKVASEVKGISSEVEIEYIRQKGLKCDK